MIYLTTLGGLHAAIDDAPTSGALAQPTPLLLLAFVSAHGDAWISRDRIVSTLWPDAPSDAKGRQLLSQTIYALRKTAGHELFETRARELRLDTTRIDVDSRRFRAAMKDQRWLDAIALYRGPFLDGTVARRSAILEQWIDLERADLERLFRKACAVALREARTAEPEGAERPHGTGMSAIRDIRLAQLGATVDDHELAITALAELRAAGYVREAADAGLALLRRVVLVTGEEAPPALQQSVSDLVQLANVRGQATATAPPVTAPEVPPTPPANAIDTVRQPQDDKPAAWLVRLLRRRRHIVAALPIAGIAMAALLLSMWQGADARPRSTGKRLGVPLEVEITGETPSPDRLFWRIRDRVRSAPVFAEYTADASGTYSATLQHVALAPHGAVRVSLRRQHFPDTLFTIACPDQGGPERCADDVAIALLQSAHPDLRYGFLVRAGDATRSFVAYREFLLGERWFELGEMGKAVDAYERALGHDSLFAHAAYRQSHAADWIGNEAIMVQAADRAVRAAGHHASSVSLRDRRLFEANVDFRELRVDAAENALRQLVLEHPDDIEAQYLLAEVRFHLSPLRGRPIAAAEAPLRAVLAADPGHLESLSHLARLAGRGGDLRLLDSLVTAIADHGNEREVSLISMYRDLVRGDSAAVLRAIGPAAAKDYSQHYQLLIRGLLYGGSLPVVAAIGDRIREHNASNSSTAHAERQAIALALVAQGRVEEALASLGGVDADYYLGTRAWIISHPLFPQPRPRIAIYRDSLRRWRVPLAASTDSIAAVMAFQAMHPIIVPYLDGLMSHALGDAAAIARARVRLRANTSWARQYHVDSVVPALEQSLAAHEALVRGDTTRAMSLLRRLPPPLPVYKRNLISVFGRERALSLTIASQRDTSLTTLQALDALTEGFYTDIIYLVPALRAKAAVYARRGETEVAERLVAQADSLWRNR